MTSLNWSLRRGKVSALSNHFPIYTLDYDDGLLVYEIYIRTTYGLYEFNINATTGQILKVKREDVLKSYCYTYITKLFILKNTCRLILFYL